MYFQLKAQPYFGYDLKFNHIQNSICLPLNSKPLSWKVTRPFPSSMMWTKALRQSEAMIKQSPCPAGPHLPSNRSPQKLCCSDRVKCSQNMEFRLLSSAPIEKQECKYYEDIVEVYVYKVTIVYTSIEIINNAAAK